jgi:predicted transcriptional regulator
MLQLRQCNNEDKRMAKAMSDIQAAHELLDDLPDNASWDDIAYRIEVRASIERGLADSRAGRTLPHEEVIKEFGITQ